MFETSTPKKPNPCSSTPKSSSKRKYSTKNISLDVLLYRPKTESQHCPKVKQIWFI